MQDTTITDSLLGPALSAWNTVPAVRDTIWVGIQDRLDLVVTAAATLAGAIFGFGGAYWITIKEWRRRDHLNNLDSARSWSAATEQVRICLDRMHGIVTKKAGRSELYWVPEIALQFYRTCPDLDCVHKFRLIDEIVHQVNYNLRQGNMNAAIGFAEEYYRGLSDRLEVIREGLRQFVESKRLVGVLIPEAAPQLVTKTLDSN